MQIKHKETVGYRLLVHRVNSSDSDVRKAGEMFLCARDNDKTKYNRYLLSAGMWVDSALTFLQYTY